MNAQLPTPKTPRARSRRFKFQNLKLEFLSWAFWKVGVGIYWELALRSCGVDRRSVAVPAPDRRYEVFAERARELVPRRESPVAPRGGVVDLSRPGIDDRLALGVRLPRDPGARKRPADDGVDLVGGRTEGADVVRRPPQPLARRRRQRH